MKKLFAILAISGALVACNNESDSGKMSSADSTKIADSTKKAVDAAQMAADTNKAKMSADTNKMKASADTNKMKPADKKTN